MKTRTIIGVIGTGNKDLPEVVGRAARAVGKWIAKCGAHLLTGGGAGIMQAAARGFCSIKERRGLSIGVIPKGRDPKLYPNEWVELPIYTHLRGADPKGRDSRNHIVIRSSTAVIAMPGHSGTQAEVEIALALKKPLFVILLGNEPIGKLSMTYFQRRGIPVFDNEADALQALLKFLKKKQSAGDSA